jgi:hypothetical protein
MNSPILFCHYGISDYLKYTLKSARFFNPNTEIVLLGDSLNRSLAISENIRHVYFKDYESSELLFNFEKVYSHTAGDSHGREFWLQFNFKRYYYIHEFLRQESKNSCWYFDSDVLILSNLKKQELKFQKFDFAVHSNLNGFINSIQSLFLYLEHNISAFTDNQFLLNQRNKIDLNPNLALTEMATFTSFIQTKKINHSILKTNFNSESFDECLLVADGMEIIELPFQEKKYKKLYADLRGNIFCRDADSLFFVKMMTLNMSGAPTSLYRKIFYTSLTSKYFNNFNPFLNYKYILGFNYSIILRFWHRILSYLFCKVPHI